MDIQGLKDLNKRQQKALGLAEQIYKLGFDVDVTPRNTRRSPTRSKKKASPKAVSRPAGKSNGAGISKHWAKVRRYAKKHDVSWAKAREACAT